MNKRWILLILVLGFMPMVLAMRPVDDALLKAASNGDPSLVQVLIEKQADVNVANKDGETPLYNAAEKGDQVIVALLLDKGANLKHVTTDGATALHIAAELGH